MKQIFLDLLNQLNSVFTAWNGGTPPGYCKGQYVYYNNLTYRSNTDNNVTTPGSGQVIEGTNILYWLPTPFFIGTGGVQLIPFIAVWNNQVAQVSSGGTYSFSMPAIFIEFITGNVIVLSDGIESFDPFEIRIHIVDNMIDSGDGTQDQNLRIFDFKEQVYSLLKNFKPCNCVPLFRVSETQDYNHDNIYHYMQTYRTNYVDSSMQKPVGYITYTYPPQSQPITFTVQPSFPTN